MSVNQLDSNGLEIKSISDIISSLTAALQTIYGSDINVDSNSPDGQLINIQAQAIEDLLELLMAVYNSFDPDEAYGTTLDSRLAINGVERRAATYTVTHVSITTDRAPVTLQGLSDIGYSDPAILDPNGTGYTVNDGAGNEFILEVTTTIASPGTNSLIFRAKNIGQVQPQLNTITNQTTIIAGVTVVNNPLAADSLGVDEETDSEYKMRRALMFFLPAVGPADSVRASILQLEGVTDCYVGENNTSSPSSGIAANSIWVIVDGGVDEDIAQAIYAKKSSGCGMTLSGIDDVTITITRPAGDTIDIDFNRPIEEDLYIELTLVPKKSGVTFDTDAIKTALVAALVYKLNQTASINEIVTAMITIEPDAYITDLGVSTDGVSYLDLITSTDIQSKFVLDVARIDITV